MEMLEDVVPAKLLKVTVHGATIASLLYAVTAGGAPCDGLVFGDTVTTTSQHLQDDDDPATVTESRAAITSTLCCASGGSFYDAAGQLDESRLQSLVQRQPHGAPLLGWLSYRPLLPLSLSSPSSSSSQPIALTSVSGAAGGALGCGSGGTAGSALRPSMREAAVTQALLLRQLDRHAAGLATGGGAGGAGDGPVGQQAVLLVLLGGGLDHAGATLTWQIRIFQARQSTSTGKLVLEPVELQTLNLGGHTGHDAYTQLHAAATAAPLPLLPAAGLPRRAAQAAPGPGSSPGAGMPSVSGSPPSPLIGGMNSPVAAVAAASPPQPATPGAGGAGDATAAAAAALAAGARAQVTGVKAHCESMLSSLNELCKAAAGGAAELVELRRRRDELLVAVAAAAATAAR